MYDTYAETLLSTYTSNFASGNWNLPAPTMRMTQRLGDLNSYLGAPQQEFGNTELYERHGSYHESTEEERQQSIKEAAGPIAACGLSEADIQSEIKNISIGHARELLLKLLQQDPHAKRIMEIEILSTLKAEKRGIGQSQKRNFCDGKYSIKCPTFSQWGYDDQNFSFAVYSTSSRLWISFNLGAISGVMLSGLPKVGERVCAQWWGSEDGGHICFSDTNIAFLTFFGDGNFECDFGGDFRLGGAHFTGSKSADLPENTKAEIEKLKTEYRNYKHDYEVANKQRWGKLGGEEKTDSPFDTSFGDVPETVGWDDGHKRKANARNELDDDESIRLMKRQRLKVDTIY